MLLRLMDHARAQPPVLAGIDVLERHGFRELQGRRVGLITNHSGRDAAGRSTIDLLYHAPGVKLVALFSPEHGLRGDVDRLVASGRDAVTGLPIYSLYGAERRPTAASLRGMDTLVYDIQDLGVRFYTYITTMGYCLEAASAAGLEFVVLDRPAPLNGEVLEGDLMDPARFAFTGYYRIPVRYGMTVGELARYYFVRNLRGRLSVVPLQGWRRSMYYDETGLPWINPSPNI
ncbi:MAG: DUF1343 domain-containing protein, partial [Nevskia sp.]|nr:DUF1343 domain-containing protein [Nevskia sp.]